MLNSFSSCLSEKLFISPSYLNETLAGYNNQECVFFCFIILNMFCHSLLAWRVSIERSAVSLWEFPCVAFVVFPLLLLIFDLCVWSSLIWLVCVLGYFALDLSCWNSLGFLDLVVYFLPHFREVFNYYLLKYFLMVFLFVFFFWNFYDAKVWAFNIVPEVSEVVLISFIFFPIFLSASFISTILSSTLLIFCSASVVRLLIFYLPLYLSSVLPQLFSVLQSALDLSYCIIHYWMTLFYLF